jgi:hypothetical protein
MFSASGAQIREDHFLRHAGKRVSPQKRETTCEKKRSSRSNASRVVGSGGNASASHDRQSGNDYRIINHNA